MPQCSRCARRDFLCKVGKESSQCAECVRSSAKCDCRGPSDVEWQSLEQQEDMLEEKMRLTAVRADKLHQELREQYARMERLRKQKKSLKERSSEMLRRGIQSLNELDALDNQNGSELNERMVVASPTGDLFRELSPGFWESVSLPGTSPINPCIAGGS